MTFNPKDHMRNIKGRDYLDVKWRIAWFRDSHPLGTIETEPLLIGDVMMIRATVCDESGKKLANGMATVRSASGRGEQSWAGRDIEKAETAAIGRALAHSGYGTQFSDDDGDDLADSPVSNKGNQKASSKKAATNEQETDNIQHTEFSKAYANVKHSGKWASFADFSTFIAPLRQSGLITDDMTANQIVSIAVSEFNKVEKDAS